MKPPAVAADDSDEADQQLSRQTSKASWWRLPLWPSSQKQQPLQRLSSNQAVAEHSTSLLESLKQPQIDSQPEQQTDLSRMTSLAERPVTHPPRQQTFERRNHERRENLYLKEHYTRQLKSWNKNRRRTMSEAPNIRSRKDIVAAIAGVRGSFPDMRSLRRDATWKPTVLSRTSRGDGQIDDDYGDQGWQHTASQPPSNHSDQLEPDDLESTSDVFNDPEFWVELSRKFNLCLSMHFRDDSDREKFFVTYIEKPNLWRKVTISLNYSEAPENSLEAVLGDLHYQSDKIARIYEAIRDSLNDIQFYETVTNLKLETTNKRLHVHVAEDANEVTDFPLLSSIEHLHFQWHKNIIVKESSTYFESHLSGFVYKVKVHNRKYIKKEISTPDTVEEFLYEINALAALRKSPGVIDLVGVVVNEASTHIKGLLIEWAAGGSVADFIDAHRSEKIEWTRKEKWARQVVSGLADIHEAGFVQGDCTISNIVLDARDNVKIVDINRRGCPIGWEPPEFEGLIRSDQKVSIYIGVKSDLFQLGMILWAIAKQIEEPERRDRPLRLDEPEYPEYFRDNVHTCLSENPVDRISAKLLLERFPTIETVPLPESGRAPSPLSANDLEDMKEHQRVHPQHRWIQEASEMSSSSRPTSATYIPEQLDQEKVLAGMDQFEEASPIKQEGTDDEHPFHVLAHQDSGLAVDEDNLPSQLDDEDDPLADIDQEHRRDQQRLNSLLGPSDTSKHTFDNPSERLFPPPVHSDSGFDEAAFGELQHPGMPTSAGFSPHDQSILLPPLYNERLGFELSNLAQSSSHAVELSDQTPEPNSNINDETTPQSNPP